MFNRLMRLFADPYATAYERLCSRCEQLIAANLAIRFENDLLRDGIKLLDDRRACTIKTTVSVRCGACQFSGWVAFTDPDIDETEIAHCPCCRSELVEPVLDDVTEDE